MKESIVFLLDASPSMKVPFPTDEDTDSTTRLDCARKAVDTWIRDYVEPSQDNDTCVLFLNMERIGNTKSENDLYANITALGQGLARPTQQLMSRVHNIETSAEAESRGLQGDFCRGILTATDILEQSSQAHARRKIVLLTDAEHDILMNVEQILLAVDRLRNLQCRIEVIGFGFTKYAVYEKPASADSVKVGPQLGDDEEEQESKGGTDEDESDSDETPEGCVRYTDKDDREALLLSLVEKTGGSVVAASNMQQILEVGQSIFSMSKAGDAEGLIDLTETPRPNKISRLNTSSVEWACVRCTLINDFATISCQACGAARMERPPPTGETANKARQENPSFPHRARFPPVPSYITVVSLNVTEFKPSQAAPSDWMPIPAFAAEILRYSPDVICLQEVPPGREQFLFTEGYQCVGTCRSHCAYVALLLKRDWVPHASIVSGIQSPALLVSVEFASKTIVFGSCHLAPFGEGSYQRLEQMREIREHVEGSILILAGDFNMRQKEDRSFEALGFEDAWKATGSAKDKKFTWDSVDRSPKDQPGTGPHNRYHGADAFQFSCRFDRIYHRGAELAAESFDLIANKPLTNPFHFLSDHFGMVSTFTVKGKESNATACHG